MATTRQKKEAVLRKLGDILSRAETAVFVNFHGLSVGDASSMRAALREEGVGYLVAKKTLIKRALSGAAKGDVPELPGEIAIAHLPKAPGADVTAPARGVHAFAKKFEERVAILGGIFGGTFLSREEMREIAEIPSQHVLYGMFVNVINSPIQGLVVVLGAIAGKKQ
jgi:large subunit ribosomal protein L10